LFSFGFLSDFCEAEEIYLGKENLLGAFRRNARQEKNEKKYVLKFNRAI